MKQQLGSIAVVAALVGTLTAQAHGPGPEYVPIARLIQNLSAEVKKAPTDMESYYLLGRVHYFAFVAPQKGSGKSGVITFDAFGKSKAPDFSYKRTPKQQLTHVREAIVNLSKALELRGEKPQYFPFANRRGFYELCLACALEDGAEYASQIESLPKLPATTKAWTTAAIENYWLAYERSEQENLARPGGQELVSEEAGDSYRRLIEKRGDLTEQEHARLARITQTLKTLKGRMIVVTPIVFSLKPQTGLSSLLAPRQQVRFDLDGTGRRQQLSWVSPETAILCWDPEGKGKITSGKQLFGSVTWWMFWRDGYAAMAALDDNHDGWLMGRELSGLALWFDRNQNGVSDPGEVVPIAQTPVTGLATAATSEESGSPRNTAGLRLRDGSMLPTWDWVVLDRPG